MIRRANLLFLLVGIVLAFVPNLRSAVGFPVYYLVFLYSIFFWITQATSWNILSGYSGYFSFGQAAFTGAGLYTTAVLTLQFDLNFFLAIPIAGTVAMLIALLIGFVSFRLRSIRGEVFTLLTFIMAFVLAAVARLSKFIDGGQGRAVEVPDYPAVLGSYTDLIYRMGLAMVIIALMIAYGIQYSKFGRGLFAIRDDEDVAEALGTPTFRYKMIVFAISGFLAGASGAIHSLQLSYVTIEDTFNFIIPLFVILMSTLGGRNHWLGPVFGAIVIYSLQDRLSGAGFADTSQILLGVVLILTILFVPEGLYGRLRSRWRLAAAIFVTVFVAQLVLGAFGSALTCFVVSVIVLLPALIVPARYLFWAGWLVPSTSRDAAGERLPDRVAPDQGAGEALPR